MDRSLFFYTLSQLRTKRIDRLPDLLVTFLCNRRWVFLFTFDVSCPNQLNLTVVICAVACTFFETVSRKYFLIISVLLMDAFIELRSITIHTNIILLDIVEVASITATFNWVVEGSKLVLPVSRRYPDLEAKILSRRRIIFET